ncbi:non-ribosomal peptide synthetase [Trinickia diaoshuihuensis]|uniref:non-ribosomal peptide synthetase n=1 Tax=Trinickia diaoshuihuensis TaxID=2292265 RepID=UPI0013C2A487|nr:non-ribosomal peptide synthetase [Trinickia diaoshuihuensis]
MTNTLNLLLQRRATEQPGRVAYRYCAQADAPEESITYGELHADALSIARLLIEQGASGGRVALFDASGLDFVRAFFGILYAGATAVPLAPPHPTKPAEKLAQILTDAAPAWCLASSPMAQRIAQLKATVPELAGVAVFDCRDVVLRADTVALDLPGAEAGDIAIVQYTSGSTSAPKGVEVSHRNFIENATRVGARMAVGESTLALSWLPLYHDMGLMNGVILPLVGGYPVILMPPAGFSARPLDWLRALSRFRATLTGAPNFAYQACVDKLPGLALDEIDLSALEVAFCGAEPIRAETLEAFASSFAAAGLRGEALFPCYGLAEATLFVAGGPAKSGMRRVRVARAALEKQARAVAPSDTDELVELVSCGRPADGQRLLIVDPVTRLALDERHVGEIWVQGPSVARGYLNRESESQQVFEGRLAGPRAEGRFLRTGDLGFLVDGELVVTGRLKDLIIVHGENHYPQDVELSVERAHRALRPHAGAAAAFRAPEGGEALLVVQEISRTWRGGTDEIIGCVRSAVAQQHGIAPAAVVLIRQGTIARTTSGKIQRAAVRRAWEQGSLEVVAQWRAPVSAVSYANEAVPAGDLRTQLKYLWSRVLGVEVDGDAGHFFEQGGDSLKVVELAASASAQWNVEVSADEIFRAPTFQALAVHIERLLAQRALGGDAAASAEPTAAPPRQGPLSALQSGIWLSEQTGDAGPAYHIAVALTLTGELDVERLAAAVSSVVRRHDILRARFATRDGVVLQEIAAPFDVRLAAADSTPAGIGAAMEAFACEPFDLADGPPCRFRLWRLDERSHRLAIVVHHLVADGWSIRQIIDELGRLYAEGGEAREAALADPAPQYLAWLARGATSVDMQDGLREYWKRALAGAPERLAIPTDGAPRDRRSLRGASLDVQIESSRLVALRALARAHGVTLYTVLLAAFQLLMSRLSEQDDIMVCSPFAGRPTLDVQRTVGLFANMVVLRTDLSGNPRFDELLARVRDTVLGAQQAASVPFAQVLLDLENRCGATAHGDFQLEFILQPALTPFEPISGLRASAHLIPTRTARFDLALALFEEDDRLWGALNFSSDQFAPETVRAWLGQWHALLDAAVAAPRAMISELMSKLHCDEAGLVLQWSGVANTYPSVHLYEMFDLQVRRSPDAVALIYDGGRLTYAELARGARRVARYLQRAGVGPETVVALSVERSPRMIMALLGVLAAGGAYLPLDIDLPPQRLAYMLRNAGARLVLTEGAAHGRFEDFDVETIDVATALEQCGPDDCGAPLAPLHGENLAYVIYTSGSTGTPKGVAGRHAGAVNYVHFLIEHYGIGATDVVLNVSALAFDASLRDIFGPLSCGATLVLVSGNEGRDPARYRADITRYAVTRLLSITPSFLRALCDSAATPTPSLRTILVSGEVLDRELCARVKRVMGEHVRIFNQYGPTECTMTSTWFDTSNPSGHRLPIGRPLANVFSLVLDDAMQPVPACMPGELYIGGVGVTRGYAGRPDLTAERFVPNPFGNGDRLYRTGDKVRWRADGQLDYLGRTDFQVKIRGARVELGEIEAVLLRHPSIRQAAVLAHAEQGGELRLTAYLAATGVALDPAALRRHMRAAVPDYAVPSGFVQLSELPLTTSGKVDRRALAAVQAPLLRSTHVVPDTFVARQLADLFDQMLGGVQCGMTDNFFTLGGHSLMATQAIARIRDRFGVELSIREFFEAPTVGHVARRIERLLPSGEPRKDVAHAHPSEVGS